MILFLFVACNPNKSIDENNWFCKSDYLWISNLFKQMINSYDKLFGLKV